MWRRLFILASVAAFLAGCGGGTVSADGLREPTPSQATPAGPPFRTLSLDPIERAVSELSRLGTADEMSAREALAAIYKHAGYSAAARFYENTAHESQRKDLVLTPLMDIGGWGGGTRELEDAPHRVALRASDLISNGRYREAIAVAQAEIEDNGPTLELAVGWAYATLCLAMKTPADVSPEAREVAERLFLTSLEERVPRPIGIDSKADGYDVLARAFFFFGDKVSARTAAKLALDDLEKQGPSALQSMIGQRMRQLIERTE